MNSVAGTRARVREETERRNGRWPMCSHVGGLCLAYEATNAIGHDQFASLLLFIASADAGARLTLQKSQSGFTLQVTGPVRKSEPGTLSLERLSALGKRFHSLRTGDDIR